MKKIFTHSLIIAAVVLIFSNFVFAQREKTVSTASQMYVISAKAGGVNFVEGKVAIVRTSGKSGYLLKGDTVEIGDKITTGADGKAEILLNPGSYIRLAPDSEFEFVTTDLDDLRLKLSKGSAILEVFADKEYSVAMETPHGQFLAVKSGVYRVDILENGAKLEVWEGKARVSATEVKEGRAAIITNGQMTVAKFDRDEKDALETWSKTRAKELTRLNVRLERRNLRNTLISGFHNNSWNMYNSFGLWIYDASVSGYCFFPFGYGWRSPYGFGYGWNAWNLYLPYYIYYQPMNPVINNPNNSANNTDRRRDNPPYQTIQNDVGTSPNNSRNPQDNDSFPTVRQPQPIIVVPSTTNNGARTRDN